jgi:hypothetical protein
MTDLSRGARPRRGGRRPGWLLLTVLLVLAIGASSALVFTDRIQLLKLAVILSLWAAAVAAFVSVIYRRQSDLDRAKARDLKLVYDLQLDREISARREYELEVESQLRRELASELRAQAADEVSALRAELSALRTNLEILFDADLSHRPAIEPERTPVRAYSDWERDTEITDPGQRIPRFVESTPGPGDDGTENAIIDVPEEPAVPEEVDVEPEAPAPQPVWIAPQQGPPEQTEQPPAQPPPEHGGRHGARVGDENWQPVPAEGQWLPPGAPGRNWTSANGATPAAPGPMPSEPAAAEHAPYAQEGQVRGRHYQSGDPGAQPAAAARHASGVDSYPPPLPTPPPVEDSAARHGADGDVAANSRHAEGQGLSAAELLARLQAGAASGGGRRRRRDG